MLMMTSLTKESTIIWLVTVAALTLAQRDESRDNTIYYEDPADECITKAEYKKMSSINSDVLRKEFGRMEDRLQSKLDLLLRIISDCEDGVIVAGQCLLISSDKRDWYGAYESCLAQNATLVSLADPAAFQQYMARNYGGTGDRFWLGASDILSEGQWAWLNGEPLGDRFPWANGEPNDAGGHEDCLQWDVHTRVFNDDTCNNSDRYRYVCEKEHTPPKCTIPQPTDCEDGVIVAGQCLLISSDKRDWYGAYESCLAQNATLVTLADPAAFQQYMTRNYGGTGERFWLGASDILSEGHWAWLNGEPLADWFPWAKGEPNDAGGHEDCLQWGWRNGEFNDDTCNDSDKYRYVCEKGSL